MNLKSSVRLALPLLLLATIPCWSQTSHLSDLLAKLTLTLRNKTAVPLRLPTHIPNLDNERELYAILISSDTIGYEVVLGATPDCEGQHVCSYGFLLGTKRPVSDFVDSERNGVPVSLHKGIKGVFYDTVCGAYCSESLLVWREGEYNYIVGLKAERESTLITAVNSAIDSPW